MRFTPKSAAPAVSVAAAVATALIGSGYAVAQDNSDASLGLEEITVTARKVEENSSGGAGGDRASRKAIRRVSSS
ncbi:MAG: hypothetical protein H7A18_07050 [Sinobacteraceae bacterium]|nr:hypothetical protein [Nevskiaceae bacterium]